MVFQKERAKRNAMQENRSRDLVDGKCCAVGHGRQGFDKDILILGEEQRHEALCFIQCHHPGLVVQAMQYCFLKFLSIVHHGTVEGPLLRVIGTQVIAVPVQICP